MLRTKNKKNCAGGRLEVDLKQLASRPNQNKTTEKTESIFFSKSLTKRNTFRSHRDCLNTELNNNAPSFSFAAIYYSYAIEVPSNRGGRSAAQHNPAAGSPKEAFRL